MILKAHDIVFSKQNCTFNFILPMKNEFSKAHEFETSSPKHLCSSMKFLTKGSFCQRNGNGTSQINKKEIQYVRKED
jgi:hypothetical protein